MSCNARPTMLQLFQRARAKLTLIISTSHSTKEPIVKTTEYHRLCFDFIVKNCISGF